MEEEEKYTSINRTHPYHSCWSQLVSVMEATLQQDNTTDLYTKG